jgi:heterodisulfide reductase subunit A-like polyferredoxin
MISGPLEVVCRGRHLGSWPSAKLIGHRTSNELPPSTDVVVIGSGITGVFAAQELVDARRRVLMVEAREACWGATGRVCI